MGPGKYVLYFPLFLNQEKNYLIVVLDATAKPMPGILRGNLQQLGNYDQCIQINARVNASEIEGKYCDAMIVKENNSELLTVASVIVVYTVFETLYPISGLDDGRPQYSCGWLS